MLVSGDVKTNKYVALTDVGKYVIYGNDSWRPYNSSFKSLCTQTNMGQSKNHELNHEEASEYGFKFHINASEKPKKLSLPEEMVAFNPKIYFGGVFDGGINGFGDISDTYSEETSGNINVTAEVDVRINFKNNDRMDIIFKADADELTDGFASLYGKYSAYFKDKNGNDTNASYANGKEIESIYYYDCNVIQNSTSDVDYVFESIDETDWICDVTVKRGSLIIPNQYREIYEGVCLVEKEIVKEQDIKNSNFSGYSDSNIYLWIQPATDFKVIFSEAEQEITYPTFTWKYGVIYKGGIYPEEQGSYTFRLATSNSPSPIATRTISINNYTSTEFTGSTTISVSDSYTAFTPVVYVTTGNSNETRDITIYSGITYPTNGAAFGEFNLLSSATIVNAEGSEDPTNIEIRFVAKKNSTSYDSTTYYLYGNVKKDNVYIIPEAGRTFSFGWENEIVLEFTHEEVYKNDKIVFTVTSSNSLSGDVYVADGEGDETGATQIGDNIWEATVTQNNIRTGMLCFIVPF